MNLESLCSFLPELPHVFLRRYELLDHIKRNPGIGRRILSEKMNVSERIIREEIEILKDQEFINVTGAGTEITSTGKALLVELHKDYGSLNRLKELSLQVQHKLRVKKVVVVKGDSEKDSYAMTKLGLQGADLLLESLKADDYIGITGGRTMYTMAKEMRSQKPFEVTFIPARGGLGVSAEVQANSIVVLLASKLYAKYKLLTIPDGIGQETLDLLLKNKEVSEVYRAIEKLDVLVFGIGRADNMSEKRGMSEKRRRMVLEQGAVGEAFGHYFRLDGKEVYRQDSVGLTLEDFLRIPLVIGIAGGKSKAEAITAVSTLRPNMTLVIDEMAAKEILNIK
ncbi:MAG: sugar-binding domain-containing protein [Tissierellia bacterium]|nr:sugar-binding domain-containing protein [Tissierellia bacterium]